MKVTQSLKLQSSLMITSEMRLAIQILAMNTQEINDLIDEELQKNPCLIENPSNDFFYKKKYSSDILLNKHIDIVDFRKFLLDQVRISNFNNIEKSIAIGLIYSLDDDGLLVDYEQVIIYLCNELSVWPEWIESVRLRIMKLEPLGCAAKSVSEALASQAEILFGPKSQVILDLFAYLKKAREYHQISAENLLNLKALSPRPAQAFRVFSPSEYSEADLQVTQSRDSFYITLLKRPSGRILCEKPQYKIFARNFSRANFLLKSLRYREHSLKRVAQSIVEYQAGWFFKALQLKALTLKQIAAQVGLHESSVSRLVRNKYIATDAGIFELKYFFTGLTKCVDNNLFASNISVKNLIREIIRQEDSKNPLSDEDIRNKLKTSGFIISRRTVSKYRLSMGILPTFQRRRLK